ncbi:MAG: chorismate synthase [Saprospiraceae bacterium]|nr:chorismate synthase [Saprospiraceae bacterium]
MSGSSFGTLFKISTFGESHGSGIGVVIDGCPAGLTISQNDIQQELDRRRPGQSSIVTQRKESDTVKILSGIWNNQTLGTPIALIIMNEDHISADYDQIKGTFRPSHGDFTWQTKFGLRDYRGGGRSSARETAARVAAGAIASKLIAHYGIEILSFVQQVSSISVPEYFSGFSKEDIEKNIIRCPDPETAEKMIAFIEKIRDEGDTIGGIVKTIIRNCPVGLGEPVFDKLHADLGKAMLSINACKGFEIGSGFQSIQLKGSQHNDEFYQDGDHVKTKTNHSGGIQGGISNGMDIVFSSVFKPVATIMQTQTTIDLEGQSVELKAKGRHDPCVLPRAVPIVDAMAALVMADHLLRTRSNKL